MPELDCIVCIYVHVNWLSPVCMWFSLNWTSLVSIDFLLSLGHFPALLQHSLSDSNQGGVLWLLLHMCETLRKYCIVFDDTHSCKLTIECWQHNSSLQSYAVTMFSKVLQVFAKQQMHQLIRLSSMAAECGRIGLAALWNFVFWNTFYAFGSSGWVLQNPFVISLNSGCRNSLCEYGPPGCLFLSNLICFVCLLSVNQSFHNHTEPVHKSLHCRSEQCLSWISSCVFMCTWLCACESLWIGLPQWACAMESFSSCCEVCQTPFCIAANSCSLTKFLLCASCVCKLCALNQIDFFSFNPKW